MEGIRERVEKAGGVRWACDGLSFDASFRSAIAHGGVQTRQLIRCTKGVDDHLNYERQGTRCSCHRSCWALSYDTVVSGDEAERCRGSRLRFDREGNIQFRPDYLSNT